MYHILRTEMLLQIHLRWKRGFPTDLSAEVGGGRNEICHDLNIVLSQ